VSADPKDVEALRAKILAAPPVVSCGHLSRTFDGACMTCADNERRRADMARAWDEGHRFTGYEPERGENPYRDAP
jgi:hypothetical protein